MSKNNSFGMALSFKIALHSQKLCYFIERVMPYEWGYILDY